MPVHLQDMFRKEVDTIVELGVLIPVSEPTDGVTVLSSLKQLMANEEVAKIRVCLDLPD